MTDPAPEANVMQSDLKPCPFCGATKRDLSNAGNACNYAIVCLVCDAEGPWVGFDPKVAGGLGAAVEAAHAAWNCRPVLAALQEPIGQVGEDG